MLMSTAPNQQNRTQSTSSTCSSACIGAQEEDEEGEENVDETSCYQQYHSDEDSENHISQQQDGGKEDEEEEEEAAVIVSMLGIRVAAEGCLAAEEGLQFDENRANENAILIYLQTVGPNKLRFFTESIKRIQRLRLKLPDPLCSIAGPYNKDAANGTLRQLVQRTEEFAATCVDSYATFQTTRAYAFVPKDTIDAMIPMLNDSVQAALSEFHIELACLLGDCEEELGSFLCSPFVAIREALECCYQTARYNNKKRLHLWEVD